MKIISKYKVWTSLMLVSTLSARLCGQHSDTSIFFRYAATFNQLLPSNYYPVSSYMPDTASLLLLNYGPVNTSMQKHVSMEEHRGDLQKSQEIGTYKYVWDAQGRVIRYQEFYPGENAAHLNVGFSFLIQSKVQEIIAVEGNNVDTARFQYNRSGGVGTWRRHSIGADSGYVMNGTKMYDSRQRVIVATNMKYGPLSGSYIYEYNNDGQLTRRAFLAGGTGVILCTDTLEYAFQSESHSVLQVTHKLKVAGDEKWTTLESQNVYPYSNVVISYTDYNDADSNYFYRNYPEYTVRYEYDDKGRVTGEYFGTLVTPDQLTAKYYYSTLMAPDSVVYSERITEKKSSYSRVYSRDIRSYDGVGRIVNRSITTYLFEEKKKKDLTVPYEVVNINYEWK
jgi:hypothetical protein